ncbi:MAG TPA: Holliday junction resolvase RuvX [Ignavibacteria bacterium]|nr:Holliday junction resolvase RuvX [Ignavibacteria bacterium]
MAKIIGIDYGTVRIGIAISDDNKSISFSRPHLPNNNEFFKKLSEIISSEQVDKIIIGYPLNLKSEKTNQTLKTEEFKNSLETFIQNSGLKTHIEFYDERFSSSIAEQQIIETGMNKKKRKNKGLVDSYSAQIILQGYLDKKNFNK